MVPMQVILHPTDFSEASRPAYRLACSLAKEHDAQLIILHVVAPSAIAYGDAMTEMVRAGSREEIKHMFQRLHAPAPTVPVEHVIEEGDPVATILRVAKEKKVEQIVMGTHGRTGLNRLLMGSVAENVLRHAECPVVIVRGKSSEAT